MRPGGPRRYAPQAKVLLALRGGEQRTGQDLSTATVAEQRWARSTHALHDAQLEHDPARPQSLLHGLLRLAGLLLPAAERRVAPSRSRVEAERPALGQDPERRDERERDEHLVLALVHQQADAGRVPRPQAELQRAREGRRLSATAGRARAPGGRRRGPTLSAPRASLACQSIGGCSGRLPSGWSYRAICWTCCRPRRRHVGRSASPFRDEKDAQPARGGSGTHEIKDDLVARLRARLGPGARRVGRRRRRRRAKRRQREVPLGERRREMRRRWAGESCWRRRAEGGGR